MAQRNAYAAYQNSKVLTASPAELTLMLYEGAIRFCNVAIASIDKGDVQVAHNNIMKAQRVIQELQATLDMKYPVAEDFNKVYNYLISRLMEANLEKNVEILEEVLKHMRTMRDTWKEVMQINAANKNHVS
ncbi:MAG: flagellar export chaperone FliS [Agathobacter sp.]|nr:flagellar export chaperone FliS [Agathobacter sp.]MBQ2283859.1 flagellar export chaperone FliS [Agathobacter sp.]